MSDSPDAYASEYFEDREAARENHGYYANRIYVQPLSDGMMRVNFGLLIDGEPSYHSSIVVTPSHAKVFANVLTRMADVILGPPPLVRTNVAPPPTFTPDKPHGAE